jgi:hypothetical protein
MDFNELLKVIGTRDAIFKALNEATAIQLKDLLETKHLYQRVTVDAHRVLLEVRDREMPGHRDVPIPPHATALLAQQRQQLTAVTEESSKTIPPGASLLILKNAKLFCSACEAREAFHPLLFTDMTSSLAPKVLDASLVGLQVFALAYQCQSCLGAPVCLLLRREGWQLVLEGRSPMEEVEVPPFIPKQERSFYRDALVAIHAGKTLAALFYLRTFVEQFARRQTGAQDKKVPGDDLMAAYGATLPSDHRDHMPSLGDWYGQLSKSLHEADEDPEFFEKAIAAINQHFDIRRVFNIPDAKTQPAKVGS